jgi:uncharacterized membrane protein (Fun14 family)
LPVEDFLFSAGGGFLFGAVAGYAIKKVIKIAAVVIGLFVAVLAYLSYRGWVDVKWVAMEDASRSTLTDASQQVVHALNNTATQFAVHPSTLAGSGLDSSYVWIRTRTNDGVQEGVRRVVDEKTNMNKLGNIRCVNSTFNINYTPSICGPTILLLVWLWAWLLRRTKRLQPCRCMLQSYPGIVMDISKGIERYQDTMFI